MHENILKVLLIVGMFVFTYVLLPLISDFIEYISDKRKTKEEKEEEAFETKTWMHFPDGIV